MLQEASVQMIIFPSPAAATCPVLDTALQAASAVPSQYSQPFGSFVYVGPLVHIRRLFPVFVCAGIVTVRFSTAQYCNPNCKLCMISRAAETRAVVFALLSRTRMTDARIPIITITTRISMRVNPLPFCTTFLCESNFISSYLRQKYIRKEYT